MSHKITQLEKILITRDGNTPAEARALLHEMMDRVMEGEDPEEILHEIGLEPDYIFDLIP